MGGVEGGELGAQPGVSVGDGRADAARGEGCAVVGGVAVDAGDVEEAVAGVEFEGVVGDEVVVHGGVVGEEGWVGGIGAGEFVDCVCGLECYCVEVSEAVEGVYGVGAVGACYEGVVLVLRFADCAESGEGLGSDDYAVEEVVVAAIVGGGLECDTSCSC